MPRPDASSHHRHLLRTFGTLKVDGAQAEGAARGRRRSLALIALAAASGETGVGRDSVLSLLWPESSADRAANTFRQTLYSLRKDLGEDSILLDASVIRLNPDRFDVDVWRFMKAMQESRFEIAADAYTGPFVDGFGVPRLPGFARWVDEHRERFQRQIERALLELAARAAADDRHADAIAIWRRIVALDRLSARYALGLIGALADSGNRASALEYARVYELVVRNELDSDPDPEVTALVDRLRATRTPMPARRVSARPRPSDPALAASADASPERAWLGSLRDHWAHHRRATVAIGLMTAFGLGAVAIVATRTARVSAPTVAVLPFANESDANPDLGPTIAAELGADVDGAGALRTVPRTTVATSLARLQGAALASHAAGSGVAKSVGARFFVLGKVQGKPPDRMRLSASLYAARGDRLGPEMAVEGDAANARSLTRDLAASLIAQQYASPRDASLKRALLGTRSLVAIKEYLLGEAALDAAAFPLAVEHFERATREDSAFAAAYVRLRLASTRAGDSDAARRASLHLGRQVPARR